MAKGKRSDRRRKGDSSSEEEDDEGKQEIVAVKDLDFAARREIQRKAAADKRRSKLRCHICGKPGHVRRECPGIADDGRGESKFTKAKGDGGAKLLASSGRKGSNRSRKSSGDSTDNVRLVLPEAFTRKEGDDGVASADVNPKDQFAFYDAGCDIAETIEYLQSGRGAKNKQSQKAAIEEYQRTLLAVESSSNFGGLISRSILKLGRPWTAPLEVFSKAFFVVGLHRDFMYNDAEQESTVASLLETAKDNGNIVGFYSDLDYVHMTLKRPGLDKQSQFRRLRCACRAAGESGLAVQVRTSPSVASSTDSVYEEVMADMEAIIQESTSLYPSIKFHISCWSGSSDSMLQLLRTYPDNIWIGMDASVGFSKAKHLHECAFDIPLSRLVLETGSPSTIPAAVGQATGREAFSHSGYIPHIAEAVAHLKPEALCITAEAVAREASENVLSVYPQLQQLA